MNRTETRLPEFTRMMWASDRAAYVWQGRIQSISRYLLERERESCLRGRVALQYITPEELPKLSTWATQRKLAVLLLNPELQAASYRSFPAGYVQGQPWHIRVAILHPMFANTFMKAWQSGDNIEIGNALGYPRCCIRFFEEYWIRERWLDTTWPMLGGLHDSPAYVRGIDECNILLRWVGVRAVPHLPCSFHCGHTKMMADSFHDKNSQEYRWIMEMLSWPVEWSALHGVARIKTPLFEVSTRTDHTNELYVLRKEGVAYPSEGASGLVFPFRSGSEQEATLWTDNGFKSLTAMNRAHTVLLSIIKELDIIPERIYDLGCGNGTLLKKIGGILPTVELHGVDNVHQYESPHFHKMRIQDLTHGENEDLAIIGVNRFTDSDALPIVEKFRWALVYSYDGLEPDLAGWTELLSKTDSGTWAKLFARL